LNSLVYKLKEEGFYVSELPLSTKTCHISSNGTMEELWYFSQ